MAASATTPAMLMMPANSLIVPWVGADEVGGPATLAGVDGFGSFFKRVGARVTRVVKAVAPIAAPIVGGVVGGPGGIMVGQAVGQAFQPPGVVAQPQDAVASAFITPPFVAMPAHPSPASVPVPMSPAAIAPPTAAGVTPSTLLILGALGLLAVLLATSRRR